MDVADVLAFMGVGLAGLYLLVLGGISLTAPAKAARFLAGFAGTASRHYVEITLRIAAGAAMLRLAPRTDFSAALSVFGWTLLATSAVLLAIPWRVHQRFAQRAVSRATRSRAALGIGATALGAFLLLAIL